MIYYKEENIEGDYISAEGTRYTLQCARRIRTPQGINIGWEEFPDLDTCLRAWGLRYEPEEEETPL